MLTDGALQPRLLFLLVLVLVLVRGNSHTQQKVRSVNHTLYQTTCLKRGKGIYYCRLCVIFFIDHKSIL